MTVKEHENICEVKQVGLRGELNQMNTKLADSGDQIKKIDTKLETIQKGVSKMTTSIAVLEDRAKRGG